MKGSAQKRRCGEIEKVGLSQHGAQGSGGRAEKSSSFLLSYPPPPPSLMGSRFHHIFFREEGASSSPRPSLTLVESEKKCGGHRRPLGVAVLGSAGVSPSLWSGAYSGRGEEGGGRPNDRKRKEGGRIWMDVDGDREGGRERRH